MTGSCVELSMRDEFQVVESEQSRTDTKVELSRVWSSEGGMTQRA